ncbi:septation protein A [Ideonella livida]|uniref:Inner membrane-spanning protein YciB n=1 Tax=Ideonella livida TaxID=2707176 RepID=A0A7C9TJ71_9BURK|nr:septation protein A [Ideonella livida]NDY90763.1 septation protein A [Ideonella livida]
MKLLLDFLPLILFFGTFKYAESHKDWAAGFASEHFGALVSGGVVGPDEAPVLLSTLVVIVATLAQVLILKLRGRKVDLMLWISLVMVVGLGGLTIWLHDETFIKWKPTGLYLAFSVVLAVSERFFRRNLIRTLLGDQLPLPAAAWRRINAAWVLFFAVIAVLNIAVAYSVDTATWVNFKVFGITGLMAVFMVGLGVYIHRVLPPETPEAPRSTEEGPQ